MNAVSISTCNNIKFGIDLLKLEGLVSSTFAVVRADPDAGTSGEKANDRGHERVNEGISQDESATISGKHQGVVQQASVERDDMHTSSGRKTVNDGKEVSGLAL